MAATRTPACGKPTLTDGTPCRNRAGCTANHQPAAPAPATGQQPAGPPSVPAADPLASGYLTGPDPFTVAYPTPGGDTRPSGPDGAALRTLSFMGLVATYRAQINRHEEGDLPRYSYEQYDQAVAEARIEARDIFEAFEIARQIPPDDQAEAAELSEAVAAYRAALDRFEDSGGRGVSDADLLDETAADIGDHAINLVERWSVRTDPALLASRAAAAGPTARAGVAVNPSTPPEVLAVLAADPDPDVRWCVANNPSSSEKTKATARTVTGLLAD